ncbi:MAG TPA: beta-N-acetylhexosaminidase [Beutenbergiaceae bacterium]|nr:beta-N-acetylhexosaminidase [Beutenbergiaceae bacterium]
MRPPEEEITALVDRCLLIGMPGTTLAPQYCDWLAEGLGGVILFARNIVDQTQLAALSGQLRAAAGPELIIALDEEGGDVTRLHARDGSPTPGNLALGAIDDTDLTRATARGIGSELAAAGISLNLAPVADVNTCAENPIIGTRSFGADPELVARHAVAYLHGLAEAGIPGCAKHFPGHGEAGVDSHLALPTVTGQLEAHLVPFRAVIAAGIRAIMCAHIRYPALDDKPATLSPAILTGLLREQLGFTGAIITDSLTMQAISGPVGLGPGCVQALAAGADVLCLNAGYDGARAARAELVAAVVSGEVPLSRLQEAADRAGALARAGAGAISVPSASRGHGGSNDAQARPSTSVAPGPQWRGELARRVLLVDLPAGPPPGVPFVIELAKPRGGVEPSTSSLLQIMHQAHTDVAGVRLYDRSAGIDLRQAVAEALHRAADRPVVLVVADAHRRPEHREAIKQVRAHHPGGVVVGTGTTADAHLAPGAYLGARSGARVNLQAVAGLLLTPQ